MLLLLALVLGTSASAQLTQKSKGVTPDNIFTAILEKSAATKAIAEELNEFGAMSTDAEVRSALIGAAPDQWTLDLPITAVTPKGLKLNLRRNIITQPGTRVKVASSGASKPGASLGLHYAGAIEGQPGSSVAFSVLDGEMVGTINEAGGRVLTIGKIRNYTKTKGEPDTYVIYPAEQVSEKTPLNCATEDSYEPYTPQVLATDPLRKSSVGCVGIYLEVDYNIVVNKGGVDAASQYVAAIFNQVQVLYDQINVGVYISEVLAWDTPSPYAGSSSLDYLFSFQAFRRSFNGDIAHLVSYGASGGVAVLNGLCHRRVANRMSFSSIQTSFASVPTYSWSVMVMAHEIGHQLGSQHTHACVWNGDGTAIDGCAGGTEGNCPNPGTPRGGGTIMSYCHIRGVGINFNKGFGPQPTAVIVDRVSGSLACLNNDCPTDGGDDGDDDDGDGDGDGGNDDGGDGGGGGDEGGGGGDEGCEGGRMVNFRLTLDDFGMETTWRVITQPGEEVMISGGPYPKKRKGVSSDTTFCLPDGCYTLQVFDGDADGICCEFGNGSFELTNVTDDNVLASGNGEFDAEFNDDFCVDASGGNGGDDNGGGPTDCPAFDFSYYRPESYGTSQDEGTVRIMEDGNTILLENNAWKAIRLPYEVTEDTWVSFWFKSTSQGDIHGIGFDNNSVISSGYTFRLHGTQRWGIGEYDTYPNDGQWHYFEIHVGQFYTGRADWLFFSADKDIGSRASNSYFRAVTVTEGGPCNETGPQATTSELQHAEAEVRLTPNPADGEVAIDVADLPVATAFSITDVNGRVVHRGTIGAAGVRVDVSKLAAGAYLFRLADGPVPVVKRFIVAH